jgi:TetR/AcrR family transcriptional regulator, tetracycline repressor protein
MSTESPDRTENSERHRLSKAAVVDRALALADAGGLDTLTIRKLAQDLGVTPMALYWHFRSKDELLDGLADRVWGEIDVTVDPGAPWPDQLRRLMESLIKVLREHPSAPQLLLAGGKNSQAALNANEVALEVLTGGGFDPVYASAIARSTLWTGITLVMSEPGFEPGVSEADLAEMLRTRRVLLATLPVAVYPRLVECAATMTTSDDPEFHYRLGIDIFISGVEAVAARR